MNVHTTNFTLLLYRRFRRSFAVAQTEPITCNHYIWNVSRSNAVKNANLFAAMKLAVWVIHSTTNSECGVDCVMNILH